MSQSDNDKKTEDKPAAKVSVQRDETSRKARDKYAKMSPAAVCDELGTDAQNGLTESHALELLNIHKENRLTSPPGRSAWEMFYDQMSDILVIILFIAAIVAFSIAAATGAAWDEYGLIYFSLYNAICIYII